MDMSFWTRSFPRPVCPARGYFGRHPRPFGTNLRGERDRRPSAKFSCRRENRLQSTQQKGSRLSRFHRSLAGLRHRRRFLQQGSYKNSDPVILRQNTARTPLPGGPEQQLHIDSRIPGGAFPLMAVVTWMLEDFTEKMVRPRIVPGSQRRPEFPPDKAADPDEVVVTGTRGSVLIMDAAAWHGGGANRSMQQDGVCCRPTSTGFQAGLRFLSNMPEELYAQMTPRQKQTMGYTTQPPVDEFTRIGARSYEPAKPLPYSLQRATRYEFRYCCPLARIRRCGTLAIVRYSRGTDNGISVLAMDGDPDAPGLAVADSAMVVDIRDPKGRR